jgi:7-cyano-7-deazaguanine synthase in queuosine biosynthesis
MKSDGTPTYEATEEQMKEKPYDLVILFSGGADSVLMMEMAKDFGKTPLCVIIDYQQLNCDEIKVAQNLLKRRYRGVAHRTVKLHDLAIQSGLTGSGVKSRFEGVHEMHVPSRNLMFVGIAASIAEDNGVDLIWYGADYSDYVNKFPDCMQAWFGAVNDVLGINGPYPMRLEAPLAGLSKKTILEALESKGITDKEIYSGYGGL